MEFLKINEEAQYTLKMPENKLRLIFFLPVHLMHYSFWWIQVKVLCAQYCHIGAQLSPCNCRSQHNV